MLWTYLGKVPRSGSTACEGAQPTFCSRSTTRSGIWSVSFTLSCHSFIHTMCVSRFQRLSGSASNSARDGRSSSMSSRKGPKIDPLRCL